MNATPERPPETNRIEISNHAQLRAMQRLGVIKSAAQHVRELLATAEAVDVSHVAGQAWQAGRVTIVTDNDGTVVRTLFKTEAAA